MATGDAPFYACALPKVIQAWRMGLRTTLEPLWFGVVQVAGPPGKKRKRKSKRRKSECLKVLRERHTTGEMRFTLLVFTLSSLAALALPHTDVVTAADVGRYLGQESVHPADKHAPAS